jgi:hypothetical protein
MTRPAAALATLPFLLWIPVVAGDQPTPPVKTFEQDVKPIFRSHCVTCHNADRPRGDLDLSSFAGVMRGGTSGKVALPGKAEESLVYALPSHLDDPKMPPNKPKIPQRELDVIHDWLAGGAVEKTGAASSVASRPPARLGGLGAATPLGRATAVTALAVSPTAPLAAVAGRRQVLIFDLSGPKLLGGLPFPEGEVHVLKFSRDGRLLLAGGGVGGASGKVVGFNVEGWQRAFEVGDELDAVIAADISPDGTKVALGGPTRLVKVFAVTGEKLLHTFRKATDWVTAVAFSPDGLLVTAGDRFGGLYVWEAASGQEFAVLRGHTKAITGLAWRADGDVLASTSDDGTIRQWDMHTAAEVSKIDAHPGGALSLDWHSRGVLVSAGRDQRVNVWDGGGKPVGRVGPAADQVQRVALAMGGQAVLAGDWSGDVRLWPLDGKPGVALPLPVAAPKPVAPVVPEMVVKVAPAKPVLSAARRAELESAKADAVRAAAELKDAEAALAALKRVVEARAEAARKADARVKDIEAGKGGSQ